MATIDVKDAANQTVAIEKPLAPGRAAAAASRPVVLSTEDLASLEAIVAAIEAIPAGGDASAANQATIISALASLIGHVDGVEALLTALNGKDFATQTTLAAVLAKLIAAPATEAKQDTLIAKDFATQTTLAALLAKVIAAPATEAKQDTIIGHVDGIETLLGTTNTTLTTIDGRVDTLEAAIGATNETAANADTGTFGLNALIKRQLAKMTSALVAQLGARTVAQSPAVNIATDDPQIGTKVTAVTALGAGGAGLIGWLSQIWDRLNTGLSVTFTNQAYSASATFTPAASSHTAGDVNGGAQEFANMGPSGGRVMITSAALEIDGASAEATAWRLYLYSVTPPSALSDLGDFLLASGDRASFLGQIDLGTAVDLGDTQYVESNLINKQIKLAGTSVFGYLVNLTTLTPAAVGHIVTLHTVPL